MQCSSAFLHNPGGSDRKQVERGNRVVWALIVFAAVVSGPVILSRAVFVSSLLSRRLLLSRLTRSKRKPVEETKLFRYCGCGWDCKFRAHQQKCSRKYLYTKGVHRFCRIIIIFMRIASLILENGKIKMNVNKPCGKRREKEGPRENHFEHIISSRFN